MSFEGILTLIVLIAIGRWIVRSVMQPGVGGSEATRVPGRDAQTRTAPPRTSARPVARAKPGDALRHSAPRSDRPPSRRPQAHAGDASPDDWYIVLDVPRDAPRSEIMAAVRLRMDRARAAGDTSAGTRIMRAARTGLGGEGASALARKLGLRTP